jgi:predicted nucleic acid-binding protein
VRTVFADTVFWVAAANPKDQWADKLRELEPTLADTRILTTDEVLVELLGHFSHTGSFFRQKAAEIAKAVLENPNVTVVPQSRDSFLRGLRLYEGRSDKAYSLVDCISMETMRQHAISEALTADNHFTQEGFVALFLQPGLAGP